MKSEFVTRFGISKRGLAKAYRRIAGIFEKYGWVQERLGNPEVGYCALGASYKAGKEEPGRTVFTLVPLRRLATDNTMGVVNWNDSPGRTKAEVIGAFRKAARLLEHGAKVSA